MTAELSLIVAMDPQGVIGRDGDLPWRYSEDLRWFKQVTMGHALLMGRRCYESIGRPLPGRRNIVLTRNRDFEAPGCEVRHDLESGLATAYERDPSPFIIGGADLYARCLPRVTHLYLTEIAASYDGDVHFPDWEREAFTELWRRQGEEPDLLFRVLRRTDAACR